MQGVVGTLVLFAACGAVVVATGIRLSRYGDIIADKTGLGGMWVGVALMSAVTSLPELVAGLSAVTIVNAPEIAVGDVVGSCMFNLAILAMLDFGQPERLSARVHQGHILVAGFGLVQLGLAALTVLAGSQIPALGWVGWPSVAFLGTYLLAMRMMFTAERQRSAVVNEVAAERRGSEMSLRRATLLYAANAALLVGAALFLPALSERLAAQTGMTESFVGSLFLAAATSMPEVVVSVTAARIGAVDMAVGNLLGSNIFNIAILSIDDIAYREGPLLASVSSSHLITLTAAMLMTAISIIGLTYRVQRRRSRLSWESVAKLVVYAAGITLLWRLS